MLLWWKGGNEGGSHIESIALSVDLFGVWDKLRFSVMAGFPP